jgi:hypothetical protein
MIAHIHSEIWTSSFAAYPSMLLVTTWCEECRKRANSNHVAYPHGWDRQLPGSDLGNLSYLRFYTFFLILRLVSQEYMMTFHHDCFLQWKTWSKRAWWSFDRLTLFSKGTPRRNRSWTKGTVKTSPRFSFYVQITTLYHHLASRETTVCAWAEADSEIV